MSTLSVGSIKALIDNLREWAQNEEMVDQYYTEHGKYCNLASDELESMLWRERNK